jgi:hypothetical protein
VDVEPADIFYFISALVLKVYVVADGIGGLDGCIGFGRFL